MLLGDRISEALATVGVTEAAASKWLGAPCGCEERRQKLNSLDLWARRVLSRPLAGAREMLDRILT